MRHAIQDDTLERAAAMPPGTLGHAWGEFMGRRKFSADDRPPVRSTWMHRLAAHWQQLGSAQHPAGTATCLGRRSPAGVACSGKLSRMTARR